MSGLEGNPHVSPLDDAIVFSADGEPTQNIEFLLDNLARATKAVAYEQRTANLIASQEFIVIPVYLIAARPGLNEGSSK